MATVVPTTASVGMILEDEDMVAMSSVVLDLAMLFQSNGLGNQDGTLRCERCCQSSS